MAAALVIGAAGGIGTAIADALEAGPVIDRITRLSRRDGDIDLTDEASVEEAARRLSDDGAAFDLIFDATGVLEAAGSGPEKSFKDLSPDAMMDAFAVNAIGPALIFKHFGPLLARDNKAVIATLSARVGSIGDNRLGGWMSYRASKAALNQFVRCAAIELKRTRKHSIVVALHPGTIETPLTRAYARGKYTASPQEAAHQMLSVLQKLTPEDSGKFFDYAGKEIPW